MATLEQLMLRLENLGVVDVLLPFLLIFTILYAVLSRVNLFGKGRKNFNVIIALVISLLVVIPHVTRSYPPGADVVEIIGKALPNVSLVLVLVIMVFVLLGIFGVEANWVTSGTAGFVVLIAFLTVFYIFGHAAGWFRYLPNWLDNPETQSLVVIILVFGLIIAWVTRDSEAGETKYGLSKIGEGLSKLFKKV